MFNLKLISYSQVNPEIGLKCSVEELIPYQARVSNKENQENHETGKGLIDYLIRKLHWSPFELVSVCFEIETTRAISAQIMRHGSFKFNELSQRYTSDISVQYPELRKNGASNRQSSIPFTPEEDLARIAAQAVLVRAVDSAYEAYEELVKYHNIAPECARFILPMATETTLYMNGTLRSYIHYCVVRTEEHAQLEHRKIAEGIWRTLRTIYPEVTKAAEKYNKVLRDIKEV